MEFFKNTIREKKLTKIKQVVENFSIHINSDKLGKGFLFLLNNHYYNYIRAGFIISLLAVQGGGECGENGIDI